MKICSKCNIEKAFNAFYKCRTHSDGYGSWCKECNHKRNQSEHTKERNRNYNRSPKGSQVRKKYAKSKKGSIIIKKALERYRSTEKYTEYRRSYRQLVRVKKQ